MTRILAPILPYLLIAALAGLSWFIWQNARLSEDNARLSAENTVLKSYAETMERIADAPPIDLDDACAVLGELHRLAGQRPGDLHCDEN